MTRRTKASRRAAFRRHCALPVRPPVVRLTFLGGFIELTAGESLDPGQLVTRGSDGRAYRAVR